MKRALRILVVSMGCLLFLSVGGSLAVYFLVDFDRLVGEQVQALKPSIEEALGRKVEVGAIRTGFFPTLGATVESISVAGKGEGDPPLLSAGPTSIDISIWKAILTFGRTLEVKEIALRGPRVHLERDPEGRLSIDDLLEAKGDGGEDDSPPASLPAGFRVGEVRIEQAAIELVDRTVSPAVTAVIDRIDLRVRDIARERPIDVKLALAALAKEQNVFLSFVAGPLPSLPPEGLPPLRDLRFQAKEVDLAALAPYLGDAGKQIRSARLSAELALPRFAPSSPLEVDGSLTLAGARLEGGTPFDLVVRTRSRLDPEAGDLSIDDLLVDLGGMKLLAKGKASSLHSVPRFEGMEVRSEGLDLGKALAFLPSAAASLPEGSRLAGPLAILARASGTVEEQRVHLSVDLGEADLLLPGILAKPAGTPLSLQGDASLAKDGATIEGIRFRLAELDLAASGAIPSFSPPAYDVSIRAKPFSFDSVARLAPSISESLRNAGASAAGQGSVEGHLKGGERNVDLRLAASLLGADLRVPQTQVEGDVRMDLAVRGDPEGDIEVRLALDASSSRLFVEGLVDKARGTPMEAKVRAHRKGNRLELPDFDVRLAELRLEAEGALAPDGDAALRLTLPPVDLEKLSQTFVSLPSELVAGGRLEGSMSIAGNPARLETLAVTIPSLRGKLGASDFDFSASVRNLEAPTVEGRLRSNHLDLDALRGESGSDEKESDGPAERREDSPGLRRIQARAELDVARMRFGGREMRDVVAKVVLKDGLLTVEEARFDLYGGRVSAARSQAEIWRGSMPFAIHLEAKNVDVQAAILGETGKASPLAGRGNLSIDLEGHGTEREDLERSLAGLWTLSMEQGRLVGPDIGGAVLRDFTALPAFATGKPVGDRALRDLFGAFRVERGKMHLDKPLAFSLGGNDLVLGGAVGIFGDLFLEGDFHVTPRLVSTLSGGRCRSDRPLPVPMTLSGPLSEPKVGSDGKKIASNLAQACLAGAVGEAVEKVVGEKAVEEVRERVDHAKAEAEAQARRLQEEADRKAKAVQAEADRKKREAEEQAKKKAKDAASKLKKKIGF